jgi:hypothetical protein
LGVRRVYAESSRRQAKKKIAPRNADEYGHTQNLAFGLGKNTPSDGWRRPTALLVAPAGRLGGWGRWRRDRRAM